MEENEGVPDQRVGRQLDTRQEVHARTPEEAEKLFQRAVDRLLDVNRWDKICGPLSAVFRLTDETGSEVDATAKVGYYFKIDVPGPGPASGEGFDWVRIEALEDRRDPAAADESVLLRVRPSPSPLNTDPDTAHFFREDATSSFLIRRSGNEIAAEVHGRNEVPNTTAHSIKDTVRNAVVGTGAVAGMSNPQWNKLVNGLLGDGDHQ